MTPSVFLPIYLSWNAFSMGMSEHRSNEDHGLSVADNCSNDVSWGATINIFNFGHICPKLKMFQPLFLLPKTKARISAFSVEVCENVQPCEIEGWFQPDAHTDGQ